MKIGNLALTKIIRDKIDNDGPVSFAWFMEQALYHPEHGYYSSGRASIGRGGDYYTNVSVGPLFGQLLAAQFHEIWQRMGEVDRPEDGFAGANRFTIVEQGAHDGRFAQDVLAAIQRSSGEFFAAVDYRIVEPFALRQDRQAQTLREFAGRVRWARSLENLEPFCGIHFSNELLDAMPADLTDRAVGLAGDKLVLVERSSTPEATSAVLDWIDHLAAKLQRGFVIAIDYGFARPEFREVVQARVQHRHLDSPFEAIGEADITTHVNWTDVAERAEKNGLRVAGFTDQHHFLTGIISQWPALVAGEKTKRALQTLLHPEMMGRAFQVLVLSKDVDPRASSLAGLKFARDARFQLGLQ